jgi:hypothetical protein
MPDQKLVDLASGAPAVSTDIIYAVKDPSGTPADAKLTLGEVKTFIVGKSAIGYAIDGGGEAISTGVIGTGLTIPFNCTINKWTLQADQSGSIVIDIWKDTYANFPPTVADTITGSAKPTISASNKGNSSTLTGWTTTITAGDILYFNVDSCSTITQVTLTMEVTKT